MLSKFESDMYPEIFTKVRDSLNGMFKKIRFFINNVEILTY